MWQLARDRYNKYNPDNQVGFLFVNSRDSSEQVAGFLGDYNLSLPVRFDEGAEIENAYGVSLIPTTFFINRDRVVVFVQKGMFPDVLTIETQMQQTLGSSVVVNPSPQPSTPTPPPETTPKPTPAEKLNNPTWEQLVSFLERDDTDRHPYVYPAFVCEDFANMLQDHATKAGIRCAVVHVQLSGYPDWFGYGIPSNTGHACNAFQTDRGLVYIDDTGQPSGQLPPMGADKTVDIQVGRDYIPYGLFPSMGWSSQWGDMGTITAINPARWNGE